MDRGYEIVFDKFIYTASFGLLKITKIAGQDIWIDNLEWNLDQIQKCEKYSCASLPYHF
jgi:hypothetical protein